MSDEELIIIDEEEEDEDEIEFLKRVVKKLDSKGRVIVINEISE